MCFASGDKKSVCARSHLNVSHREYDGFVSWWYELVSNNWFKGPMISPKCVCVGFFFFLFCFCFCFIHHRWHLCFCCWQHWSGRLRGVGTFPAMASCHQGLPMASPPVKGLGQTENLA